VIISLTMSIPAGRYLFRRRGPVVGIAFPLVYWAVLIAAGLAVTRGRISWQSLAICGACAALSVGYSVYLAIWRSDLRFTPQTKSPHEDAPTLRACPACGIQIDAQAKKCPLCGAASSSDEQVRQ
jgi:uncharacterized paraquat-inducible protein A